MYFPMADYLTRGIRRRRTAKTPLTASFAPAKLLRAEQRYIFQTSFSAARKRTRTALKGWRRRRASLGFKWIMLQNISFGIFSINRLIATRIIVKDYINIFDNSFTKTNLFYSFPLKFSIQRRPVYKNPVISVI